VRTPTVVSLEPKLILEALPPAPPYVMALVLSYPILTVLPDNMGVMVVGLVDLVDNAGISV